MKNLKLSALIAFVAMGSFFFSACSDDGGTDPAKPVLNFLAGAGYVSADGDITAGSEFTVGLSASHESKIEKLVVTVSYDGGTEVSPVNCTLCDTMINEKSFTIDFTNKVEDTPGSETWFFAVSDKDGNTTKKSITFNRTAVPSAIRTINATLGNQWSSSFGSSLILQDISVALLADAKANSENVDLLYIFDEDNSLAYLGAPSSATTQKYLPSVATWTTKNKTQFRKTSYSVAQFGAMSDSKELLSEISSSAGTSSDISVAAGDVIFVKPVSPNGRYALIKIATVGAAGSGSGNDNTISLDVLVEDK